MPKTAVHWALALAAGAALLIAACTSDEPDQRGLRFYAEIAVEVEPRADDPLARIGAESEGSSSIRWWYAWPDRWRWEIASEGPSIDAGKLLTVSDGTAPGTVDAR